METLRQLLIQRAARLQERPALSCRAWGTLNYSQYRNRIEGVALGLMADKPAVGELVFMDQKDLGWFNAYEQLEQFLAIQEPWSWICEVAAATCGLVWNLEGYRINPSIAGGALFNNELGRGEFHNRDQEINKATLLTLTHSHAQMLSKMQRTNSILGWDHKSEIHLPIEHLTTPVGRAMLWNGIYGGSHIILKDPPRLSRWLKPWGTKNDHAKALEYLSNFWEI